mmetsp:Transcript_87161/g.154331  ORF Transcript_87161/g.154331 Transcript_87161/m.154331 type:complete len:193 (-) Transcript_87161:74-652(-)
MAARLSWRQPKVRWRNNSANLRRVALACLAALAAGGTFTVQASTRRQVLQLAPVVAGLARLAPAVAVEKPPPVPGEYRSTVYDLASRMKNALFQAVSKARMGEMKAPQLNAQAFKIVNSYVKKYLQTDANLEEKYRTHPIFVKMQSTLEKMSPEILSGTDKKAIYASIADFSEILTLVGQTETVEGLQMAPG